MYGIFALTTIGMAFQATGIWTLQGLAALTFDFLTIAFSPPLMVNIVLLSQDSTFRIGEDDIDAFLKGLFHDGDCEWLCDSYRVGKRREGVSRSTIHVTLGHRNRRCNDPYKNIVIRDLCRKLVGMHTIRAYKFRIVPEWEISCIKDDDKFFGSCLILMQLKNFYDNFSTTPAQEGSKKSDWVDHTIWLLERYFQQFGELIAFLTPDDITAICSLTEPKPEVKKLLELLSRFVKAYVQKSKEELRQCEEEFQQVSTKDLVQLMQFSMMPLVKYGGELKDIIDSLDTNDSHELEMEYLARALCGVIGSNVPFCGAVGALSRDVESCRDSRKRWTICGVLAGGLTTICFWPVGVFILGGTALTGYGWYSKSCEYQKVQEMDKFSKELDILGSSCRMYILLVMTKVGSFFNEDTPQYETYTRLLMTNFGIKIEDEGFQVNSFVKKKGEEIFQKIRLTRHMVLEHAKGYGVKPAVGEWRW